MHKLNRAIVFDLDGTLADSVRLIEDAIVVALEPHLDVIDRAVVRSYIGQPLVVCLSEMVGIGVEDPRIPAMVDVYRAAYHPGVEREGRKLLLPGVEQMLHDLRAHGIGIGVVTAKTTPSAEHLLGHIGIAELIDVLVGTDQTERGKPFPDPAFLALEKLGAAASQTWYVGDATSDMAMAINAGMPGMGITTGIADREELLAAGAKAVVDHASQIPALTAATVPAQAG